MKDLVTDGKGFLLLLGIMLALTLIFWSPVFFDMKERKDTLKEFLTNEEIIYDEIETIGNHRIIYQYKVITSENVYIATVEKRKLQSNITLGWEVTEFIQMDLIN